MPFTQQFIIQVVKPYVMFLKARVAAANSFCNAKLYISQHLFDSLLEKKLNFVGALIQVYVSCEKNQVKPCCLYSCLKQFVLCQQCNCIAL